MPKYVTKFYVEWKTASNYFWSHVLHRNQEIRPYPFIHLCYFFFRTGSLACFFAFACNTKALQLPLSFICSLFHSHCCFWMDGQKFFDKLFLIFYPENMGMWRLHWNKPSQHPRNHKKQPVTWKQVR